MLSSRLRLEQKRLPIGFVGRAFQAAFKGGSKMTLQPNDGNEGLDTAGEAAKPWRKEAFEPEWMKKLREKAPEAVMPADNARTAKLAEGRGRLPEKESPTVFRMSRA